MEGPDVRWLDRQTEADRFRRPSDLRHRGAAPVQFGCQRVSGDAGPALPQRPRGLGLPGTSGGQPRRAASEVRPRGNPCCNRDPPCRCGLHGANDDAAGTTAMIILSKYFKKLNNNERTLIFAAFTAEEVGGFGAQYFSKQFDPLTVKAMFNIEMIGTESKWGRNSAYITGYEKTDMGAILQKNLAGSGFTFYPDPYTDQNLFYRSDNATLARLGVPAHTISTSKMDSEPNYHKPSDEFQTLDMDNMNEIIKAIAKSAQSIIAGKDTPSRVDTTQLK